MSAQSALTTIRRIGLIVAGTVAVLYICYLAFTWALYVRQHWGETSQGTVASQASSAATRCPGGAHPLSELHLSSEWTSINPNGCRFIYDIKEGEVELGDGADTALASGWIEFLPSEARITSGSVKGMYAYCPTKTGTQPINWDCEPV